MRMVIICNNFLILVQARPRTRSELGGCIHGWASAMRSHRWLSRGVDVSVTEL